MDLSGPSIDVKLKERKKEEPFFLNYYFIIFPNLRFGGHVAARGRFWWGQVQVQSEPAIFFLKKFQPNNQV
jgi:hypothetical protein